AKLDFHCSPVAIEPVAIDSSRTSTTTTASASLGAGGGAHSGAGIASNQTETGKTIDSISGSSTTITDDMVTRTAVTSTTTSKAFTSLRSPGALQQLAAMGAFSSS
ncbi:unnamed protein product, partial [Amoebophrya sp. A25]